MPPNNLIVVCDASVLINLALINHLYLLEAMFGRVYIPPAGVFDEVVRRGAGKVGLRVYKHPRSFTWYSYGIQTSQHCTRVHSAMQMRKCLSSPKNNTLI